MAKINYIKAQKPRESQWALVGKIWPHKTRENSYSGRFGLKTKTDNGLVDVFDKLEVKAGDPIMIRPNQNRREGKNDPQYLIYMLKGEAKQQS